MPRYTKQLFDRFFSEKISPKILHSIPAVPTMVWESSPPSSSQSTDIDFYPIDVLSPLPLIKETRLRETILLTPIHIHTPYAHIGMIHKSSLGLEVNCWDLILYLKDLAQIPLGSHETNVYLTQQMAAKVRGAFNHRRGQSSSIQASTLNWDGEELASDGATPHEPMGADLFLGHTQIWGLEQRSIQGYSIIHLTKPLSNSSVTRYR
jgi:hypothetical protein